MEYKTKVGDYLLPSNSSILEAKVIKITPYKTDISLVNLPGDVKYGITLLAKIKVYDNFDNENIREREIETCNIKVNPENTDINEDWQYYNNYCKGIFFTSEEEKKQFYNNKRKNNKYFHLSAAKSLGYKEKSIDVLGQFRQHSELDQLLKDKIEKILNIDMYNVTIVFHYDDTFRFFDDRIEIDNGSNYEVLSTVVNEGILYVHWYNADVQRTDVFILNPDNEEK